MNQPKLINLRKILCFCVLFLLCACMGHSPSWGATVNIEIIHSRDKYPAGDTYPILLRISIQEGWYIHGTGKGADGLIPTELTFESSPGLRVNEIQFPRPQRKQFDYTTEPLDLFSGRILVSAYLEVRENASSGPHLIKGQLSFQACSAKTCLPRETLPIGLPFTIVSPGSPSRALNPELFRPSDKELRVDTGLLGLSMGRGPLLTLLAIFFGGLGLNLTPCIYPLIPITVSYFGGRSGKIRGRSYIHGLLYILGLSTTNSSLGVAAAVSGGMLGSALQNPFVISGVAAVLVAFGLSFFGVWEFRLPSGLVRLASKNFDGYFGTFFMGLTLGIVAAPCLGPFVLGLLTYVGQKGDPVLAFLYFFVLSIGLGLPLSFLAVFSGGISRLPRSGAWMVFIQRILGWLLLGMATYVLSPLIPPGIWNSALLTLVIAASGIHLGWIDKSTKPSSRRFWYFKKALGITLIAGAVALFTTARSSKGGISWSPYDEAMLNEATKLGKPVVLDFYAEWCGPCVAMEKKAFADPEVVNLSQYFVLLRVDLTKRHPEQDQILRKYQVKGVPTVIFLNSLGSEERSLRIESYVERDEVVKRMKILATTARLSRN